MPKRVDLIGKRFGRLIVIALHHRANYQNYWLCKCDCGNEKIVVHGNLPNGHTQSCGCYHVERLHIDNTTHGYSRMGKWKKEYGIWNQMIQRCNNSNTIGYSTYGGRGISVCERWLKFENFIKDMGDRPTPKHTIDRIDNNGNYEPSNCKWATRDEQARNTRRNCWLEHNGVKMILKDWAKELKVPYQLIQHQLKTKSFSEIHTRLAINN